ncbi:MAG TPA: NAD-dependent epimerase/dehydratase family protein, partial [Longimicrobium sp.]|nr:NAD-dependent epimerase/dehydratase family protein [Longimicrobium sp.]
MAGRRVLVTGGAGFVGSHLVDALLEGGDRVRILDNLDPQVHGPDRRKPAWVPGDAEFIQGDMRSADDVRRSLRDVDVVYHLAAAVGVGQSMYQVADYTAVNTLGTANLLQALV